MRDNVNKRTGECMCTQTDLHIAISPIHSNEFIRWIWIREQLKFRQEKRVLNVKMFI